MMQAVILAAGKGTRCYPLTLTRPKPLLKIANKSILEHNLEQLRGLVDEVIIVIGHKGKMIKQQFGNVFGKMKLHYVEQKVLNGPGGAMMLCEKLLRDRFIVLNGDDLYSRYDLKRCLRHRYCVMVQKVADPEKWGIFEVKGGLVVGFEEKPRKAKSNLANIGVYVLDKAIFKYKLKKSPRGEYEGTDYVTYLVERGEKVVCEVVKDYWIPVGYLWHILEANEFLLSRMKKSEIKGKIEKGVTVKGKIVVGKGSVIKSGAYIEGNVVIGKNCVIGPNCFIRGSTAIGDGCKVGNGTEIKNSVIFNRSYASHLSYVCDSVIGEDVNFGAGTITANLRFDHADVKMSINGERISSKRKKLGAVVGDGTQTGINVSLMPGVRIWPNVCVEPGMVVCRDLMK